MELVYDQVYTIIFHDTVLYIGICWFLHERKTRGRQLHLTKRFGPKRASLLQLQKRYKTNQLICFVPFICNCTMYLTLKNQQIPIYRRDNESLLHQYCTYCICIYIYIIIYMYRQCNHTDNLHTD